MKKKIFSTALLLCLGLAACNGDDPTPVEEEVEAPTTTEDPKTDGNN